MRILLPSIEPYILQFNVLVKVMESKSVIKKQMHMELCVNMQCIKFYNSPTRILTTQTSFDHPFGHHIVRFIPYENTHIKREIQKCSGFDKVIILYLYNNH